MVLSYLEIMKMNMKCTNLNSTKSFRVYSRDNGERVWYSYNTIIAFETPKTGLVVCENIWSVTTARHLGNLAPKSARVKNDKFVEMLRETDF